MKKYFTSTILGLSLLSLAACSPKLTPSKPSPASATSATSSTSSSQDASTSSASSTSQTVEGFVEGNDEIGYVTFKRKVMIFTDLNHDESVANTRQWTESNPMRILSLTSFDKAGYTDMLKQAGQNEAGMTEVDALIMMTLEAFQGQDGVDLTAEQDTFNNIFAESAACQVILPDGATIVTVAFQPESDSQKIYLLSTEAADKADALNWLMEVLPTWSATHPG